MHSGAPPIAEARLGAHAVRSTAGTFRGQTMHDIVIRGGTIIDGTGSRASPAMSRSTAARSPRSAARPGRASARSTPTGCSSRPAGSMSTRITTARRPGTRCCRRRRGTASPPSLFGNCGVGFAPVRREHRDALIDLMEGVEDIPGAALAEGLNWEWESFPQFLDALDADAARHRCRAQIAAPRRCASMSWATARCNRKRPRPTTSPRCAALTARGAARRRVRLHHLAHLFAQDQDGELVPGAFAEEAGAVRHRPGAGRGRPRRARHGQRLR